MARIMNPQHTSRSGFATRSSIQKVCVAMGVGFILFGLAGIAMPGLLSMHLSMTHNLIHLLSGGLAWSIGYSDHSRSSYRLCLTLGLFFGFLGIAGFVIGQPGYPGVGSMAADQNLLRVFPNVLEFGTMDHRVHLLIGVVFLFSAYVWKHSRAEADRPIVKGQRRGSTTIQSSDTFDSASSPSEFPKGESYDRDRRDNFEDRL